MLSIIIPTWNEENYLPKLLDCIKKQTYKNYEIIVVDGNSTDNTLKIAKKYGCRVFREPKDIKGHPGIARNIGSKHAKGDILLFLDADVQIGNSFLEKALKDFTEKNLDIAGFYFVPLSNKFIYKIIIGVYNFLIGITQKFYANASGCALFCKKWLFRKVRGFDESIKLAEDFDFVSRCSKFGNFRIIKNAKVNFSVRRFKIEGILKVTFSYILSGTYRIFFGPDRKNIFRWTTYSQLNKKLNQWL